LFVVHFEAFRQITPIGLQSSQCRHNGHQAVEIIELLIEIEFKNHLTKTFPIDPHTDFSLVAISMSLSMVLLEAFFECSLSINTLEMTHSERKLSRLIIATTTREQMTKYEILKKKIKNKLKRLNTKKKK
jgi:hypothetical protein